MDLSHWMEPTLTSRPMRALKIDEDATTARISPDEAIRAGFGGIVFHFNDFNPCHAEIIRAASGDSPDKQFRIFAALSGLKKVSEGIIGGNHQATGLRLRLERCLGVDDAARQANRPDVLGVYCLSMREGRTANGMEVWNADSADLDSSDLLVCVSTGPVTDHQDFTCLDLFQREVSRKLIEEALQPVGALLKDLNATTGIILDIPKPSHTSEGLVPWTRDLPDLYRERWQESLQPLLPLLWFDAPGAGTFRWRFRTLLTDLFRQNFIEPLAEWGQEFSVSISALFPFEESLSQQVIEGWGPNQIFHSMFEAPAIQLPGNAARGNLPIRTAASAARQNDAGDALCFAGDFDEHKPLEKMMARAERAIAAGGLSQFVLSSPNAPISAQPWWPHIAAVNRSLARTSALAAQGKRVSGTLVLSPCDSIIALGAQPFPPTMSGIAGRRDESRAKVQDLEKSFIATLAALEAQQIDFDIADEEVIARLGQTQTNTFLVGNAEYTTVVMPPAQSWRSSTLKLLKRFIRKGGSIILPRPIAPMIDWAPSRELEEMSDGYPNIYVVERTGRPVCFALGRVEPSAIQFRGLNGQTTENYLVQHKRTESHDLFFATNTVSSTASLPFEGKIWLHGDGAVRVLDAWKPRIEVLKTEEERSGELCAFSFANSTILAFGGIAQNADPGLPYITRFNATEPLGAEWLFERLDPNFMPLRECRYVFPGANTSPIQSLPNALSELLVKAPDGEKTLIFEFESRIDESDRQIKLLLIGEFEGKAFLNDDWVALEPEASHSLASQSADISPLVKKGKNVLRIAFHETPARMSAPILSGDFAVVKDALGKMVLSPEPKTLRNGSWTDQGYPFYAGRMRYHQDFDLQIEGKKRYFLRMPKAAGAVFLLQVNDQEPEMVFSEPYRIEITRLARDGRNQLSVEVSSTLANAFAPLPEIQRGLSKIQREEQAKKPAFLPFGLIEGIVKETFDPEAPPSVIMEGVAGKSDTQQYQLDLSQPGSDEDTAEEGDVMKKDLKDEKFLDDSSFMDEEELMDVDDEDDFEDEEDEEDEDEDEEDFDEDLTDEDEEDLDEEDLDEDDEDEYLDDEDEEFDEDLEEDEDEEEDEEEDEDEDDEDEDE